MTEWKRDGKFKVKIARFRVPGNWADGIRAASRPEVSPDGEHPKLE